MNNKWSIKQKDILLFWLHIYYENIMNIKCIDCGCYPEECIVSISSFDCPNCLLDDCYCWFIVHNDESIL